MVIIDYGAGNIGSVVNACNRLGLRATVSSDPAVIAKADRIILPGVGAFRDAMRKIDVFKEALVTAAKGGTPLLGICLGMQILFERGYEFGVTDGLGLIPGEVRRIEGVGILPHMGWNRLERGADCGLSDAFAKTTYAYFVHSYMAVCDEANIATYCGYDGVRIPAVAAFGNIYGCQFHQEKSGEAGLGIIKAFAELA